ncbi:hypothetical protein [Cytobacillus kochii]
MQEGFTRKREQEKDRELRARGVYTQKRVRKGKELRALGIYAQKRAKGR